MPDVIRNWKRKEGSMRESAWLESGIRIYQSLLQKYPECTEYKMELAKLLVRCGTDEKLVYVNEMKAAKLFKKVLELFPNHVDALYRMGHVSYETKDYNMCIEYFLRAIKQPLSDIRLLRAYATIAKAFYHLVKDREAYCFLKKAKELDKENNFSSEIKEVEALITQEGYSRRIVHYPDGDIEFVSVDDAEDLQNNDESYEGTLDLAHLSPTFSGPNDTERLERKQAEVLSYLIEKNRFVTKEELVMYVWSEDEAPELSSIKSIISKINNQVKKCLPGECGNPIVNKRGHGYKWNSIDTKIIKVL
ncbi:winged helix-turn-helix domain-containing protein [Neobacillus mesonae]|uniref:winged helix-turn-helix domain-containing protein n=1 Tax=Neobacillus mesonae TaxID=1193713 RepID=UPI002040BDB1|nr:winged helix-turn-helix domain-containing protein [Neobacillus mesonae]MCM3569314.1 winged helix-turn-helix domain-containing protein [Neobacillus mesonae]